MTEPLRFFQCHRSFSNNLMKQVWPLIASSNRTNTLVASCSLCLSLIMTETGFGSRNKGRCLFFSGLLFRVGCSVCVCRPLMCNTPALASLTERCPPVTKHAERRKEWRNTKEESNVFFPSQSLINPVHQGPSI